jgi:hypothetical protein
MRARIAIVVVAGAAGGALLISSAAGGPPFLTKKQAAKLYLKKSVANRRFLTAKSAGALFYSRGEADARYYTKGEADSRYLRPAGEIRINAGPSSWVLGPAVEGTPPATTYFADAVRLRASEDGIATAEVTPTLPVALYGRQVRIVGAELCYDAQPEAVLSDVFFGIVTEVDGIGEPSPLTDLAADPTDRTDNACRRYDAPSPVTIGPADQVALVIRVDYPEAAGGTLLVGRSTFILQG